MIKIKIERGIFDTKLPEWFNNSSIEKLIDIISKYNPITGDVLEIMFELEHKRNNSEILSCFKFKVIERSYSKNTATYTLKLLKISNINV